MNERPILFSAPMVRALLVGGKTQTRRLVKPNPRDDAFALLDHGDGWWPYRSEDGESVNVDNMEYPLNCPYGAPGDHLWVRETHRTVFGQSCGLIAVDYRADPRERWERLGDAPDSLVKPTKWIPSIHMRREYSRILLEVVSVRVEQLNDCSETDAIAEGIQRIGDGFERWHPDPADIEHTGTTKDPVLSYRGLWELINGAGSWAANPWVWVIEFKRLLPAPLPPMNRSAGTRCAICCAKVGEIHLPSCPERGDSGQPKRPER